MKKYAFIRLIPDTIFMAISSFASVLFFSNFEIGLSFFIFSFEIFFWLSFSILFSFYIFKVYVLETFTLKTKLTQPIKGYLLGLGILTLVSFLYKNNAILDLGRENFFSNTIFFSSKIDFLNTAVVGWFLSFFIMISIRSWLFLYSKASKEEFRKSLIKNRKNVLVIGGAGYIGSALIRKLLKNGYKVKVLDILFFGTDPIQEFIDNPNFSLIRADFRKVDDLVLAMQDCGSVIHLGGLVGDPACAVDEYLTTEVNLTSTKIIGLIAKAAGVKRFIFASSCSVYGDQNGVLNELSETKPLSLYAKTKIASEKLLQDLASEDFCPVILRFATIFGLSNRTRFDLVVNLLTAKAYEEGNMTVFGANQTRPFLHVSDAAKAISLALEADASAVHNEIFNIGDDKLNYTILDVSKKIKERVPESKISVEKSRDDARNYRVSFAKATKILNFSSKWTLEQGIEQVLDKFSKNEIGDYSSTKYSNVMHLSESGRDLLGSLEYSGWEKELLEAQV